MVSTPEETTWVSGKLRDHMNAASDWDLQEVDDLSRLRPVTLGLGHGTLAELAAKLEPGKDKRSTKVEVPRGIMASHAPSCMDVEGRYYTVLSDSKIYRLLEEGMASDDPLHPGKNLRVEAHGTGLPDDSFGVDVPLDKVEFGNKKPKKGVVVTAVIDTGLPLFSKRFMDKTGKTRIKNAWIQDGPFRVSPEVSHVPYGREFTAAHIDQIVTDRSGTEALLDENGAYRDAHLNDFAGLDRHSLAFRHTHGAHVADIAAGLDPKTDTGCNPVIFVQFPQYATEDTSGGSLGPHLIAALDYIVDRADRIASDMNCGRLPLVINLSYGMVGGPQDGMGYLERTFDAIIRTRRDTGAPTALVLPSGNRYLGQGHAKLTSDVSFTEPQNTKTLPWRILPDDYSANAMEIWLPQTPAVPSPSRLSVKLTPPNGPALDFMPELDRETRALVAPNGKVLAKLAYEYLEAPVNRGRFTLTVGPTASYTSKPTAPAGNWKVTFKDTALLPGDHIDAWILRDDQLPNFDLIARQSRFDDPDYQRLAPNGDVNTEDTGPSPVVREGMLSVLASGRETIVAGAMFSKTETTCLYSAGGPKNKHSGRSPDTLLPGDTSRVHTGILGSGPRNGSRCLMNGTSVAAPQLTRLVAERMATGEDVTRKTIAQIVNDGESAGDFKGSKPKKPRGGNGRLKGIRPRVPRVVDA